jgi:signal transduction histidine kinase
MVSHEFRTPLSTILTSADLVTKYGDRMTEERKREHLANVKDQVHQLTRLLEDVLTLGKAESVGMDFCPMLLNLKPFCDKLIEEVQHAIGVPHRIVMTMSDGSCAETLAADEKLLRHIVSNLLSNAMKYSPEGSSIYLDVVCADGWATIRVRDEGIGIPEEDQARLFESFQRARNVGSISGTGLGLAIVKRAVEAHRGTISFESKEEVGTTFTVTIPVALETIGRQ